MGTQAKPEQQEPQNQPPSQESSSPTPETPPQQTTPTSSPPEKDEYTKLLEATLREQNARLQELTTKINSAPPPAAPQPSVEEQKQRFYNDPVNTTRDIIKEALAEQIAPLQELAKSFRSTSVLDQYRARYAGDPRFSAVVNDPKAMAAVEALMRSVDPTEQNYTAALVQVAGLKATNQLDAVLVASGIYVGPQSAPAPQPTSQSQMNTPTVPPHVRPTPPPAPSNAIPQPKTRELTENELLLARMKGMTPEQYIQWMNVPANEVVTATIGREKK